MKRQQKSPVCSRALDPQKGLETAALADGVLFLGEAMVANGLIPSVGYLRMSSDKQDKSIDDQKKEITRYAAQHGYKILRWYKDEAMSGDDDSRDDFLRLVNDAKTVRDFDAILVWSPERFSRFEPLEAAQYWFTLSKADIKIVSVTKGAMSFDTIEGQLLAFLSQHEASSFLKTLANGVTRGMASSARKGFWTCARPPFGYVAVPTDPSKPTRSKKLAPSEPAASAVQEAFRMYAETDISARQIAAWLNSQGFETARGNPWCGATVGDMLRNEVYVGTIIRGRLACGKHSRVVAGEQIPVKRRDTSPVKQDRSECIVVEDAHPAIVDRRLFQAVQRKLAERNALGRKPRPKCTALSGMLYCGHCGHKLAARTRKPTLGLVCLSGARGRSERRNECRYCVNYQAVLGAVLSKAMAEFLSDESIAKMRTAIGRSIASNRSSAAKKDARLKSVAEDLGRKIERAESRIIDAPPDMLPTLYKQIRDLRNRKQEADAELAAHERLSAVSAAAIAGEGQALARQLRMIRDGIAAADAATARAALQQIIKRVTVWTVPAVRAPGVPNAMRRRLSRVAVEFKNPLSVMSSSLCNTLDSALWNSLSESGIIPDWTAVCELV